MLWQVVHTQNIVLWRFELETASEQKARLPQSTPTKRKIRNGQIRKEIKITFLKIPTIATTLYTWSLNLKKEGKDFGTISA
jgi:hypothetical protein